MIRTRRTATALTAAAALALGVLPAAFTTTAILAEGEGTTTLDAAAAPAGSVVLTTDSSKGTITWNGATQEITGGQQCEVTSTGANLLKIRGSVGDGQTGVAGFRDGDIGVFETSAPNSGPNNASQCFRVDSGSFTETESLTLELHPDGPFSDAPFAPRLEVASATVDARVANTRDGLITIALLGPPTAAAPGGAVLETVTKPWDKEKSGNRIDLGNLALAEGNFNAIRLTATSGSFSVRGAKFDLVSQADRRFCPEESYPVGDATVTYVGETSGDVNTGTDTYGGQCFGVSMTDGAESLRFLKPLDVSPEAQFLFVKTWTKTGTFTPSVTLDGVQIDFEFFQDQRFENLPFCPAYLYKGGVLTGFTPSNPASTTELADLKSRDMVKDDPTTTKVEGDGTQFACLGEPRDIDVTSTKVVINDTVYLVGDAAMRLR